MDSPPWPYWKFGLRRDDLFSKLHDQYNTFPSSIQDPEAFHHDVSEIAHDASTADEFHGRLAQRKAERLAELNEGLESAALEIIANPALVGTEQWQHALQLFRTKSLDSLVRYFASYLPEGHRWHQTPGSFSQTCSVVDSLPLSSSASSTSASDVSASCSTSCSAIFDHDEHRLTHEPLSMTSCSLQSLTHLPPSPRSLTMCSDSSSSADADVVHRAYVVATLTPARTLSFSGSDSDRFVDLQHPRSDEDDHDEHVSEDESSSLSTSVSNLAETSLDLLQKSRSIDAAAVPESESEAATPKPLPTQQPQPPTQQHSQPQQQQEKQHRPQQQLPHMAAYFDAKPPSPAPLPATGSRDRDRSISPNSNLARPRHPLAQVYIPHHPHHHHSHSHELQTGSLPITVAHSAASQPQRGVSAVAAAAAAAAGRSRRRRSPPGRRGIGSLSRVRKSVHESVRSRPRGRQ